jgi:hypothetical protein
MLILVYVPRAAPGLPLVVGCQLRVGVRPVLV